MTDLTIPIYTNEEAARKHLEAIRWPDGVTCPLCGSVGAKALGGASMGAGWFHCVDCRRKFTVRTGSIYERSHIALNKWVLATHLMCASKKGISAHQLHRMLGITYKSAWFMCHRIREAMAGISSGPMGAGGKAVEADETYISKKEGRKLRRGVAHMRVVMTLVSREGEARSFHVAKANKKTVMPIIRENVAKDARVMTDDGAQYNSVHKEFSHETVNHTRKEYARGDVTTNSVEGFFSIFKRGMTGVYQHCAEKHLHRYLSEFDFRYSNRAALEINDDMRALKALQGAEGKRLTYRRSNSAQNLA
jgi:transposase-like protein